MSVLLRHAWAVFAVLLTLDVLACGAWLLAIPSYPSLASSDLADLLPLVVGYFLVLVSAVVAIAAGIARRLVKPEIEPGKSKSIDLLTRPLLAAAVSALGVVLLISLISKPSRSDMEAAAVVMGVTFLSVFGLVGVVTPVVRRITLRGLTVIMTVVVLSAAAALLVSDKRGRDRLVAQQEAARVEVAAERQRQQSLVRPVVVEPGVEANAVDTYRVLIEALRVYLEATPNLAYQDLPQALKSPAAPPSASVMSALERSRADLDRLRDATRSRTAFWPTEYEKGLRAEVLPWSAVRTLALLALVDGNMKAQEGDVQGASDRYLAVLRFGTDLGNGPMTAAFLGASVESLAIDALARLLRSPRGAPLLESADKGLERLTPALIEPGTGFLNERLLVAMTGPQEDPAAFAAEMMVGGGGVLDLASPFIPWNAYQADAVGRLSHTLKELQTLGASRDPSVWWKFEDEFMSRYYDPNPSKYYRDMVSADVRTYVPIMEAMMRMDALRTAVGLERRRAADGRYPEDPGPLPQDLFAKPAAKLRYRVSDDGQSFVLYSVGVDHADNGGKPPQDIVLPEGAWPEAVKANPRKPRRP